MTTKKLKAMKSLMLNKDIRVLQADRGRCTMVLDKSEYKSKLNTLLESGACEQLPKDPTAKAEKKYRNSFPNRKLLFLSI
jgi:hypothetical protein